MVFLQRSCRLFRITSSGFSKFLTEGKEFGRSTNEYIVCSRELASYARALAPSIGGGQSVPREAQVSENGVIISSRRANIYFLFLCTNGIKTITVLINNKMGSKPGVFFSLYASFGLPIAYR